MGRSTPGPTARRWWRAGACPTPSRPSADELREALTAWMRWYNTTRPHQALAWQTPAERRAEQLGRVTQAA